MMLKRLAILCGCLLFLALPATTIGQVRLMMKMAVGNTTSKTSQVFEANPEASQSQGFNFPSSIGTANQLVTVSAVTSGNATTAWTTATGGFSSLTSYLSTQVDDNGSMAKGPSVAVEASKSYRIIGEFSVYRGASDGSNDEFKVEMTIPSGSAGYTFECVNCPAGTVNAAQMVTPGGGGSLLSAEINPGGATDFCGPANTFHYRLDGVVNVGVTAGNVDFGFNKSGGADLTTLKAGSYYTLFPIPQ